MNSTDSCNYVKKGENTSKSLSTDFPNSSKLPPTPAEKFIVNGNIAGSDGKKSSTTYRKVSSECLKQVLQSVTTAQPTVKMTSPRNRNKTQNAVQVSKQKPAARKANKLVSPLKRKRLDGTNATDSKVFCPLSSDSSPIKNLEGFCVANGILQNDATKPSKSSTDRDDEDIEVDIEMDDNDGAPDSNQPPSPDSIYKSLLESAEISDSDAESNVSKDETEIAAGTYEKDNSSESEATPSESISFEEQLRGKSASLVKSAAPSSTLPVFTPEFQNDIQSDNKEKDNLNMVKADTDEILSAGSSTCDKLPPKIPEKFTHHIDNGFLSVDGNILEFPIPEKELCLPCDVISDEEQNINSEFFIGKPSKTPERYKKIRNFILDAWNKCKPSYLNKTSLRSGLKNCGDVNCIGRIHSYLECVGAINFGCEQAIYKNPIKLFHSGQLRNAHCRKEETRTLPQQPSSTTNIGLKFNGMRPRKRRVKDGSGNWIDEKDLEGRTIQHKDAPEEKPKIKICKTLKKPYDPFKLIPCSAFSDEKKPPFAVEIFSSVLTVMDIHAHISKTEVIGLLGGHYEVYENKLVISMVEPCRSLSTGMQCEMDPVSQTQACQVIHNRGLDILGWYHSHPNFAPNPSVRDIETQKKLQEWFSQGGSHFVGIIVSPYYNMNIISAIQCLTVSEEVVENHNVPYKFEYQITEDSNNERLVEQVVKLADSHSRNHSNVDLSKMYTPTSGISCLQKMMSSLDSHWFEYNILELHQTVQELFT